MLKESALINRCYILREYLGEDAFCERWRASAIFAATDFLFRVLKPEYSGMDYAANVFANDAWRSYDVASPSVLPLIDIDHFEGRPFIVSEYDGYRDLRSELAAGLPLSLEHICLLVIKLAEGIDAFHQKRICYGVLSPEAIVVNRSGNRIEELRIQKPSYSTLFSKIPDDRLDDIRDSWGYAAPEIKRGRTADFRSDIYSLGIILYRLIVGKLPYGSRSGLAVKTRSAALSHVTASLARRKVPREIAGIVVRALRKNPNLRYEDAVSFISDLRIFLDARRKASLRSGKVDPIADLATLNLKKAKAGAHEIRQSLDTVDYFRILSESDLSAPDRKELIDLIETFKMTPAIEELEELEAEGDEDDDARLVESYLDEGYALEDSENKTHGEAAAPLLQKDEPVPAAAAPMSTTPSITGGTPVMAPIAAAASNPPGPVVLPQAPAADDRPASLSVTPLEKLKPSVKWRRSRGTPEEVSQELNISLNRAGRGRGSFRFIEDPGTGESAALIRRTLSAFKLKACVVDIGTLPVGATIKTGGRIVLNALKAGAEAEPGTKRKAVLRKIAELGPWDESAEYLIRCVAVFARRGRPLVLIGNGAESIDRSFHSFFEKLADIAAYSAFCAFFFYRAGDVDSWHALSALSDRKPTAI